MYVGMVAFPGARDPSSFSSSSWCKRPVPVPVLICLSQGRSASFVSRLLAGSKRWILVDHGASSIRGEVTN